MAIDPRTYPAFTLYQYPTDPTLNIPNYHLKIRVWTDKEVLKLKPMSEYFLKRISSENLQYKILCPPRWDFNTYRVFLVINNDVQRPTLLANFRDNNITLELFYYKEPYVIFDLHTDSGEYVRWLFRYLDKELILLSNTYFIKQ